MSDTPETDAALYPMNGVDIVWPEFARELERERDEAIRARDVALKAAHTYDEAHTKACEGWAQAERERDDLRDRLNEILNPLPLKHPHETGGGGMGTLPK